MKNTFTIIGIVVIIALAAIFMMSGSENATSQSPLNPKGEVQIVKLSVEGNRYVLEPSEIKKGIPVRIEGDMARIPGCSKSIVISAFNVRKTLTSSDNIIEFTPDKAGTFNIACSMNMYRGTFTVLDDNGSKSNYVQEVNTQVTGCGMASGGGCGCGG